MPDAEKVKHYNTIMDFLEAHLETLEPVVERDIITGKEFVYGQLYLIEHLYAAIDQSDIASGVKILQQRLLAER